MADASYSQIAFLGGEWSPYFQGRTDHPRYKMAMNVCLNSLPVEEGAWTRRPGTRFIATTRFGQSARTLPFNYDAELPFSVEFTPSALRIFSGDDLVLETPADVVSISSANPAVLTLSGDPGWASGDEIEILVIVAGTAPSLAGLVNRQFVVTKLTSSTYSLTDPIDGTGLDGSVDGNVWDGTVTAQAARILQFETPYSGTSWYNNRGVQFNQQLVILNAGYAPQVLKITSADAGAGRFSTFSFGAASFYDGPYYSPVRGQTVSYTGTSGIITLNFTGGFTPNFAGAIDADVGRFVRLFIEPPDWASGTAYTLYPASGSIVKYNGAYYTCIQSNTNKPPDAYPAYWEINPEGAAWLWAIIQTVVSSTQVTAALQDGQTISSFTRSGLIWRLGLFGGADGYPNNGCFHEGRVWLCKGNTIVASQPDDPLNMQPTLLDGTVTDASSFNYTFEGGESDANKIQWLSVDNAGVVAGTFAAEWLIAASALSDPITPTNIQAKRVTKYGSGGVNPVRTGLALVFVQLYRRRVMELITDVFTGRYRAPDLAVTSRHITANQVEELAYMEERTPVVWARMRDGSLAGVTYRRISSYSNEEPSFAGWHRHTLGSNRSVVSLCITTVPVPVEAIT